MSELDILLTLYSIVAGLGISKLAQGVSVMIQARQRLRYYWVHSLWLLLVMMLHVVTIFALIRFTHSPHWNVFSAMLTLTVPLLLYLLSDLVVPAINDDDERVDLKEYFYRNRKWLMGLLIGVILCGAASQLAVEHRPDMTSGALLRIAALLVAIPGLASDRHATQGAVVLALLAIMLAAATVVSMELM